VFGGELERFKGTNVEDPNFSGIIFYGKRHLFPRYNNIRLYSQIRGKRQVLFARLIVLIHFHALGLPTSIKISDVI
jgi:hypothetical protein